ncbi:MAG TPA: hypothetical protein PLT64_09345 [Syntrophales bacterium]|nr:hypothetical protein [Syntrophales bacterium]HOL60047.1 hypothetical protein [Syntrophales bacterium]
MQLKTYEASSIQEALDMIKRDLGDSAVVLSTSRKGKLVEVVAAREGDDPAPRTSKSVPFSLSSWEWREAVSILFDLVGQQGSIKPDEWAHYYTQLVARGVSKAGASRLADRMRRHKSHDLKAIISEMVKIHEFRSRVRVLVGPTGAGKTTTLAKLAAISAFRLGERVALITTDTHRIAATDQIRIYARIMNVPVAVAADGESFRKAVERFSDRDVIYVDTPGRAFADHEAINDLAETMRGVRDLETSLVLSLTSHLEHLLFSAREYGVLVPRSVIFTKVDECINRGAICDVVESTGLPVSWWTTGQNVPEDIEQANIEGLIELIMGGCTWIRQPC